MEVLEERVPHVGEPLVEIKNLNAHPLPVDGGANASLLQVPVPSFSTQEPQQILQTDHEPTVTLSLDHQSQSQPNPWQMRSLQEICFFCCPECPFKTRAGPSFQDHAVEHHHQAKPLFDNGHIDTLVLATAVSLENPNDNKDFDIKSSMNGGTISSVKHEESIGHLMDIDDDDNERTGFACSYCSGRFKTLYILAVHLMCFHNRGNSCPSCPFVGVSMATVKKHIQDCHDNPAIVQPPPVPVLTTTAKTTPTTTVTPEDFVDDDEDEDSIPLSDSMPVYNCSHCKKPVRGLLRLAKHMRYYHNSGSRGNHLCPKCSHPARSARDLQKHIESAHDEVEKVVCPKCDKEVKMRTYKTHMTVHRQKEENRVLRCEHDGCSYSTPVKTNLDVHVKHHHSEHLHKEVCDLCGRKFLNKALLKLHKETHSKVKQHICEKCGKGFTHEVGLRAHWATVPNCDLMNSTSKEWRCDQCEDKFSKIASYLAHYRATHKGTPMNLVGVIELHHCDQCSEAFASVGGLNNHKKIIHQGIKLKPQRAKEACPYCGKLVNRSTALREHIKSKHENDTPYQCPDCPKAFGTETFLRLHIRQAHRKIKCEVCSKEVCNNFWYKRHMAKVHGVVGENAHQCDLCPAVFDTMDAKSKHMMKQHT